MKNAKMQGYIRSTVLVHQLQEDNLMFCGLENQGHIWSAPHCVLPSINNTIVAPGDS